jgi:hypothetical protein
MQVALVASVFRVLFVTSLVVPANVVPTTTLVVAAVVVVAPRR